jgi:flagellar biosynthesis protein FlhF
MRVKRYLVDSMPDALQRIRSELGKDAIILNTKEVKSGGFLGLFGKKKIEVIAAIDSTASVPSQPLVPAGKSDSKRSMTPQAAPAFAAELAAMVAIAEAQGKEPPPVVKFEAPVDHNRAVTENERFPAANERKSAKEDVMLEEIRQMKDMVSKLSAKERLSAETLPPAFSEIRDQLLDQEVLPELVGEWIGKAQDELAAAGVEPDKESAAAAVKGHMMTLLTSRGKLAKRLASDTRIVHFVGPTGVGKTTTIAKLAAEQTLKFQRKVGFITSDTYRIAAVEQLKTYATILNIPLEVVFSPLDLNKAFQRLEQCDIIFMDTAGRNFRNEMYVSELNALLQGKGKSETLLVLSLTTKYKDMRVIAENFSKFNIDKILFTKMDETETLGSIPNLLHQFSLQLSYMTNGQNVPDDIALADEHQIIGRIMGDIQDE